MNEHTGIVRLGNEMLVAFAEGVCWNPEQRAAYEAFASALQLADTRTTQPDSALREAGWSVAVHNDYRINGEPHTFWLWTHPNGRWIKGEGRTDADALAQCRAALQAESPHG